MKLELPEEILSAVSLLNKVEKSIDFEYRVSTFQEALQDLEECEADYPELKNYISNILKAHTRSLFHDLSKHRPDLDLYLWFQVVFLLCVKMKQETKQIVAGNPTMRQYLEDLLLVQAEKRPAEIRRLFAEFFE